MSNSSITEVVPSGRKPKKLITPERVVVYSVLTLCAIFFLFPLYIMVITSLKDIEAIRSGVINFFGLRPEGTTSVKDEFDMMF